MYRLISICVLCSLICLNNNEAARILAVIPTPSISHQLPFRPLTQELARRGHQVTVITTDPAFPKGQTPENLTEIDVHDISYGAWRKIVETVNNGEKSNVKKHIEDLTAVNLKIFEEQTKHPEVQDIIKNKNNNFDLIIVEAWPRFALGFSHAIKVPVIAVSSFGATYDNYDVMGAPTHPILYPVIIATRIYNLSLWEKISSYYFAISIMHKYWSIQEDSENAVVKRIFGDDTPGLRELQNNMNMLFLNIHPIWEGIRPVPPGVVHIGGIHQNPQKELPQDLQNYLDSSVNGVIYISFGTNVETSVLPAEKIQAIIKAFSQLPYNVLWKWNGDELPGRTKNIKISKWVPQTDLLRHPKIKLFITQGGLQSTDEAIIAGVPLIGIPMLADQWFNVENYVHHKIGLQLELSTLEADTVRSAIETVIKDNSYRENVVRLRTLMNDQPMSALERAVWWTEHVARHGGARHLRAPAANMGWGEYYEIDLLLVLLGITTALLVLSYLVIKYSVKFVLRQLTNNGKVKKL